MKSSWMAVATMFFLATPAHAQVTQQWAARYHGPANRIDGASALAIDDVGHIYVTGNSQYDIDKSDYATVAYDADGAQLWVARYNGLLGDRNDLAGAIAIDGLGHVFVTGSSSGSSGRDYATVAYDVATGEQLWVARYNGPGNGQHLAHALAVDAAGTIYVTGESWGGASGLDYATVAYDAATGTQLWVARYNGPGNGNDQASGIAVDGLGAVYVTGTSSGSASGLDYATVAYDAGTGAELWVARYNGPGNGNDYSDAIVVDGLGSVYVTGTSRGDTSFNYATVAYDAATGAELWVARYNGGGAFGDDARALAVDGFGNVYVTGGSAGSAGSDYATVAYDAATGAQLWVARYHGPGDGGFAVALAVDGSGKVYVTGRSGAEGGGGLDYATVAYDAATGAELWVARYAGFNNQAIAIAVDALGNVYVTGWSRVSVGRYDYATLKYSQP